VSRLTSLFYADDGAIGSLDHEWLQHANRHLCNLFRDCTGLVSNTEKTEAMNCHPGAIRGRCSNEGYKRRHEGSGDTYVRRKGKRTVCPVPSCGKDLALGSLQSHLRRQHGMDSSSSIIKEQVGLAPRSYKLSFIHQSGHSQHIVPCPVEDCPYQAATAANLRRHFYNCHHTYRLHIEEDGSIPSNCWACGMLVSLHSLRRGHVSGPQCKANKRRKQQRERNEVAAGAQARTFTIDGVTLKKVENFKYLGRQISSRDSETVSVNTIECRYSRYISCRYCETRQFYDIGKITTSKKGTKLRRLFCRYRHGAPPIFFIVPVLYK